MRTVRSRLVLALVAGLVTTARAAPIDAAFPAFGGSPASEQPSCAASAVSGDTLFLAGSLRWAGPLTGGGVPLRASDLTPLADFPRVNGTVLAATPDGEGGWYIGGAFTHVGGAPHANLAHIRADLSVDSWSPATNSDVITLVATPDEVYLGGTFTSVNRQPSSGFAGVARATGNVVLNPATSGLVAALATDGMTLYVGGEFTSVGGASRTRLAAFRLADHALAPWAPAADAGVYALRCANGVVYAGGNFTSVQGLARNGAAALDPVTAAPTAWDPHMGGFNRYGVRTLLALSDRVYLGGGFVQMGGASRLCLAAVDVVSGALMPWDPQVRRVTPGLQPPIITSLEMVGGDLLAGGDFERVGGTSCSDLVRIDTMTAIPVPATPQAPAEARALVASGENVFVGGRFSTLGASRRADLLAVRISTGELLPWAPEATRDVVESLFGSDFFHPSSVVAMAVDTAAVYVAVSFHDVYSGGSREAVSAYSRSSGAALWSVEPSGSVSSLAVLDSLLIVGGDLVSSSTGLLALDARTGARVPWGGSTSGGAVLALCATPAGLAVGGTFATAGGQPRSNLALLDRATGLATDWNPGADGAVTAFALGGATLYCGGDFGRVGGEPRARLASLSLATGEPEPWDPGANAAVRALAFQRGILYAGGGFTTVAGQQRVCVAAIHPATGEVLPWNGSIGLGHIVLALSIAGGHVFAGGDQVSAGAEPARGFSAFVAPDPVLDDGSRSARRSHGVLRVEPQPARAVAQVRLKLPRETDAEIGLYDLNGRRLAVLQPWQHHPAGEVTIALEARKLQPGIYLVRAVTPEGDIAGKLVVLP